MERQDFDQELVVGGPDLVGKNIGDRYRLLSLIGKGSVSEVYKAMDLSSVQTVALKIIKLGRQPDSDSVQLFEHNARLNVQHPNLVTVHACGLTEKGEPWLALEYLQGQDLARLLKEEGHLSVVTTLSLLEQICDAVGHIHNKGEVHMNLKPSSIILVDAPSGVPFIKLTDVGVSKLLLERELEIIDEHEPAVGSTLYLSPEQFKGERIDARSDIYSLGCIAYHCLTGRAPHEGTNLLETMDRHFKADIDFPSEPDVPIAVQNLVLNMLAKEPDARYRSLAEVRSDLALAADGKNVERKVPFVQDTQQKAYSPPLTSRRPHKKGREPWMLLLTCLTILLLIAIVQQSIAISVELHKHAAGRRHH